MKKPKTRSKDDGFLYEEQRIYAGYDLNGSALNQYQAGSFLAPITYASDKGRLSKTSSAK